LGKSTEISAFSSLPTLQRKKQMRGEKTELSRCCDSGRSKFLHQNSVGYTPYTLPSLLLTHLAGVSTSLNLRDIDVRTNILMKAKERFKWRRTCTNARKIWFSSRKREWNLWCHRAYVTRGSSNIRNKLK